MIHLEWSVNAEETAEGFLYGGWIPPLEDERVDKILREDVVPSIAAYISKSGQHIAFPKTDTQAGRAWASPRTWAIGAVLLAEARATGASADVSATLLAGSIGDAIAHEFMGYLRDLDLPNPEEVLANPAKFKRPVRQDQTFALLASLVSRVATPEGITKERHLALWTILHKVATGEDGSKDPRPDLAAAHAGQLATFLFTRKNRDKLGDIKKFLEPFKDIFVVAGMMKDG
jgi:hypothetical protein